MASLGPLLLHAALPPSTRLLQTPDKPGQQQQHRYLGAGRSDDDDDDEDAENEHDCSRLGQGQTSPARAAVGVAKASPPECSTSSISRRELPSPRSSTSSSFTLKQKLRTADQKLYCMQAQCEADLRAVIAGHEDLAERQQGLLERVHEQLLEAGQDAQVHRRVAAKVGKGVDAPLFCIGGRWTQSSVLMSDLASLSCSLSPTNVLRPRP